MWLVSTDEGQARRIDPRTGRVTATARLPLPNPVGGTAFAFPSWGIGRWSDRPARLAGYRPRGRRALWQRRGVDTAIGRAGPNFSAIAAHRGELWIVGRSRVARYNAGGRLVKSLPAARSLDDVDPRGVAVDRRTIWIADGDESLRRVLKRGGRRPSVPVGPGAYSVATGAGSAWVIADLPGSYSALYRVDARTGAITGPSVAVPDSRDIGGTQVVGGVRGRVVVGAGAIWVSRLANPSNPAKRLGRVVRIPIGSVA